MRSLRSLSQILTLNIHFYKILRKESMKLNPSLSLPTMSTPSSPALQAAIAEQFIKHKRLHAALADNTPPSCVGPAPLASGSEQTYLRVLAAALSSRVLPPEHKGSLLIASLVNEILSNCVLNPVMAMFEPSTINGWIAMAGETAGVVVGDEGGKDKAASFDAANFHMDTQVNATYVRTRSEPRTTLAPPTR